MKRQAILSGALLVTGITMIAKSFYELGKDNGIRQERTGLVNLMLHDRDLSIAYCKALLKKVTHVLEEEEA